MTEDRPPLHELITEVLVARRNDLSGLGPDGDSGIGRPALERAADYASAPDVGVRLVRSDDPTRRLVGAELLAEVGRRRDGAESTTAPLVGPALIDALAVEHDLVVRCAIVESLTRADDPRVLPVLLEVIRGAEVTARRSAAVSLPGVLSRHGQDHARWADGLAAVIDAMSDEDLEVRRRATNGLGSLLDVDSDHVREALARRLFDHDDDTRWEAIVGLARRNDARATRALVSALESEVLTSRAWDVAVILSDPRLIEPLRDVAAWWEGDEEAVQRALRSCDPERHD